MGEVLRVGEIGHVPSNQNRASSLLEIDVCLMAAEKNRAIVGYEVL